MSEERQEDNQSNRIGRIGHRQVANFLYKNGFIPADVAPDKGEDLLQAVS